MQSDKRIYTSRSNELVAYQRKDLFDAPLRCRIPEFRMMIPTLTEFGLDEDL